MTTPHIVYTFYLRAGVLTEHDDGRFRTVLYGFTPGCEVNLMAGYTHLGCVFDGELVLRYGDRERTLYAGDYFSVIGPATVTGSGRGMSSSVPGYIGINAVGGPIEPVGRLRYIDGCTDTLLIPPVRKGDPCLNHLHFPAGITQTPHNHPSVRTGLVYRGCGECVIPGRKSIPLRPGSAFIIPTDAIHSFNTADETMDVIAFHPDSDTGMTDDDHPMVNRTMVDGVSASRIPQIRTQTHAKANATRVPALVAQTRPEQLPQSYPQQRLWFLHQLEGATTEYNMPEVWRIRGPVDIEATRRAINGVIARHESLRTRFDDADGRPVQIVEPRFELDLPLCDLSGLDEQARERRTTAELRRAWEEPFDLRAGPPVRTKILKLGSRDHILVRVTHHIVTDGWSERVIFNREFASLYDALVEGRDATLPPLDLQYADYALWQRRAFESGELDVGLQYWKNELARLSGPLPMPSRRLRRNQWEAGGVLRVVVDTPLLDDTRRLARNEGVTLATVWLAAFQILLARWTGERDIPVGVVVANRERSQLKSLIGFFVNFVVVRADFRGEPTFREFLRQVANRCYDAYARQDVPLEKLVEELNPPRNLAWNPLFQVVFNMVNFPRDLPAPSDLQLEDLPIIRDVRSTFDLKVDVRADEQAVVDVSYNSHLFDRSDIAGLFDDFQALLREMVRKPEAALGLSSRRSAPLNGDGAVEPTPAENAAAPADSVASPPVLTDEQRALSEMFAEVLEVKEVAIDDDFFALGGHSLLVMMLRSRVRARLHVDLPLRAVFEAPTVRALSERLRP